MAIITTGSFADFSMSPADFSIGSIPDHRPSPTAAREEEATASVEGHLLPAEQLKFAASAESRGLAVASLRLEKGFQNFLARLLRKTSDIYFLAWCWDMSGQPMTTYPGEGAAPASVLIPMVAGSVREFIGAGAVIFPARPVVAGLAVRMQIWESAHGVREFGAKMTTVADAVESSRLNSLLTTIAMATGVAAATVALIERAALELAAAVGGVLEAGSDEYVDFYEGYFPATGPWDHGRSTYRGVDSEMTLSRF